MAKNRKMPAPFKYRGGWRAQVTLANGKRPFKDFDCLEESKGWISEQLANANTEHEPELGGPTEATLAQALKHYAGLYTVNKGGLDSELNRINHYLVGGGMKPLKKMVDEAGKLTLKPYEPAGLPKGWQKHVDTRRRLRSETYECIGELAHKRCSVLKTVDLRRLMKTMEQEGLSDSTIQKEIALLRHLFNVAAKEWAWKGFENPADGLTLGKSEARFVFITKEQEQALWKAMSECDNPYFWPLVVCALETTMRKSSLLAMRWDKTDLDGRIAQVGSKTGTVNIPLSQHIVGVLRETPRHASGRIFPMSANAVDMAWDGVRVKAGVPTLQFRDIRHLGATAYARRGFSAHQLRAVLGHKTLYMAQVYVNLVQQDVLDAMDATAPKVPVIQVPPPANASADELLKGKRSERLVAAVKAKLAKRDVDAIQPESSTTEDGAQKAQEPATGNESHDATPVPREEPREEPPSHAAEPEKNEATAIAAAPPTESRAELADSCGLQTAAVFDFASRRRRA